LKFNWDLSISGQRFALDGVKVDEFQKYYPDGFCLGWTTLKELDEKLCYHNRRVGLDELWSLGDERKLAFVIAYLASGRPITPPLISPLTNEICLHGGNHRYTAAKFGGVKDIPVYAEPSNIPALSDIVSIRWSEG
jgi:hypothetical protein